MTRQAVVRAAVLAFLLGLVPRAAEVAGAAGAGEPGGPPPSPAELVRIDAGTRVKLAPGAKAVAEIGLVVRQGWHVNAHRPSEDYLVPTVVRLVGAPGITPGAALYPPAARVKLAFAETPLAVYEGALRVRLPIEAARDARAGERTLQGTVRFQACNDQVCLPPAELAFAVRVRVEGAPLAAVPGAATVLPSGAHAASGAATPVPEAMSASPAAPTVPPGPPASPAPASPPGTAGGFETAPPPGGAGGVTGSSGASGSGSTNAISRLFEQRGSFLAFCFIFLLGLALNLTPCVYPMLGVTVALFGSGAAAGGGASGRGPSALPKAIVYVLGIALMYSSLGAAAAMTGGLFGGLLQNPWVLGGIAAVLLTMALSMFGVYELNAPTALLSRLGGAAGAGYLGTFLAGLLVGVFAAPCIGPPIIALLAHVGARADPVFGFWAFFVFSLGLGLPYLVLGASSGLISKLPRSGSWMEWVKHLFGVILLSVAAFYGVLAIAPGKLAWVVPAALGLGGLYLGFLEPTGRDRSAFRRFKWAVGVAGIVAAVLVAFRPAGPELAWEPYSELRLAQAARARAPVMIEFSADWCVPCHELDRSTFTDPSVVAAARSFVRLRVDLTRYDSPESAALRKRFAILGVPTVLFLAPDGREVGPARVVGSLGPAQFVQRLESARAATSAAGS